MLATSCVLVGRRLTGWRLWRLSMHRKSNFSRCPSAAWFWSGWVDMLRPVSNYNGHNMYTRHKMWMGLMWIRMILFWMGEKHPEFHQKRSNVQQSQQHEAIRSPSRFLLDFYSKRCKATALLPLFPWPYWWSRSSVCFVAISAWHWHGTFYT